MHMHMLMHMHARGLIAVDGVNASWAQGDVLILDDSLVHEVFAPPAAGVPSVRVILIVDIHHPDILEEERELVCPYGKQV